MNTDPPPTLKCEHCEALEQRLQALERVVTEFTEPKFLADRLYRLVQHGLSQTITAHGPITRDFMPSATKRITQNLRNSLREIFKAMEP